MSAGATTLPDTTADVRADTLAVLERLVAFDTRNPPRNIEADGEVFAFLRSRLDGFRLDIIDEGDGSVSFLAIRGNPRTLYNYHLDTVPVAEGWSRDPFALKVDGKKATGLGACDIKGALAVMLATCARTPGDVALLVSTDEEAGDSRCIRRFVARKPAFERVIVAEPTLCRAVTQHRGIISGRITFCGVAGHASQARAIHDNANHRLIHWGGALLEAIGNAAPGEPLHNLRVNLGRMEGGVKPNMIAAQAQASFNVRTPPGSDTQAIIDALRALAPAEHVSRFDTSFVAPSLPAGHEDSDTRNAERRAQDKVAWLQRLDVPASQPVDFWTEAALFDAAGYPAIVVGSGDIAQAHTADEWVALEQLDGLHALYARWLQHGAD